jgi:Putative MetA-pathway of phenol degradation
MNGLTPAAVGVLLLAALAAAEDPVRPPFLEAVRPSNGEREEAENPFADRIETDRDAFTPTVKTVEPGRFVVESAYSFIDNRRTLDTHSFPELLLRYGLAERLELRLGWNYEVGGGGNEVSSAGRSDTGLVSAGSRRPERESRLTYGVKVGVTGQDGWLPQSALILIGLTPTSGEVTTTDLAAAYVVGWELPREWRFDTALRYSTAVEEGDHYNVWSPSAVVRVPLDERRTVHVEYFGAFSSGKAESFRNHYVSAGASYLVTPDLEVGVRGGWGLNDQAPRGFINAGFGWRY